MTSVAIGDVVASVNSGLVGGGVFGRFGSEQGVVTGDTVGTEDTVADCFSKASC